MELGKSKEDYLKAIFILQMKSSDVHSVNIAEYMGVSKASVSVAMKQLRNKDYITMDNSGKLHLSPKGQALAAQIYERYSFFTSLFSQLGVPDEIARKDACAIEHVISNESYEKLRKGIIKKEQIAIFPTKRSSKPEPPVHC